MTDIYAIFGTLLAVGIAFPGFLTAWWLLFPRRVERASENLSERMWLCGLSGLIISLVIALPVFILFAISLPFANVLAGLIILFTLAIAAIGASGLSLQLSRRIHFTDVSIQPIKAYVIGAVVLELAAAFPLIGWVIFMPVTLIFSIGASALSLFAREKRNVPLVKPSEKIPAGVVSE